MLKQALKVFEKEYHYAGGDRMILDSYMLSEGTYIIVEDQGDDFRIRENRIHIKYEKGKKELDRSNDDMDFICAADYNSKLLDMNKPVGAQKIIHSNNYMSFFVKKESFTNGKLTSDIIEAYYNALENPKEKYEKSKKSMQLYDILEEEIGDVDKLKVQRIKGWILSHIFEIGAQEAGKDYLKIFFQYSKEDFIREGKRYLILNIYNSNDFNDKRDETILGLSNHNMGLNSKKPFLENKTRKVVAPYLISLDEVTMQKKFFDYLMNFAESGIQNIYIGEKIIPVPMGESLKENFSGTYFRVKKGKELEILDYDIIPCFKPELVNDFEYKNYLNIEYEKLNGEYRQYKKLADIEKLINEVFFSKFLISNYFTEPKDIKIKNDNLHRNLLLVRTKLFQWFCKGNDFGVWEAFNKVTFDLILGSIENGYMIKAMDQLNLRLSLKKYFEGGDLMEGIYKVKQELRGKINKKENDGIDVRIESDDEYFFAVGQLTSFFLSKSKGKTKPLSFAVPIIGAKNNDMIKHRLGLLYKKYNYALEYHEYRFKNLYAMVKKYDVKGKINGDMIELGFVDQNLIYEKRGEEN